MATSAEEFKRKLSKRPNPLDKLRADIEEAIQEALARGESTFSVGIIHLPVGSYEPVAQEYRNEGWKVTNENGSHYLEFTPL